MNFKDYRIAYDNTFARIEGILEDGADDSIDFNFSYTCPTYNISHIQSLFYYDLDAGTYACPSIGNLYDSVRRAIWRPSYLCGYDLRPVSELQQAVVDIHFARGSGIFEALTEIKGHSPLEILSKKLDSSCFAGLPDVVTVSTVAAKDLSRWDSPALHAGISTAIEAYTLRSLGSLRDLNFFVDTYERLISLQRVDRHFRDAGFNFHVRILRINKLAGVF